jgi:hypothetical protein
LKRKRGERKRSISWMRVMSFLSCFWVQLKERGKRKKEKEGRK